MWNAERIPANLVRGMFVMIHNKGSRNDYGNYRAICLLCHSYKLISATVALAETGVDAEVRRIVQAIFGAATGVVRIRQADGRIALFKPFNIARGEPQRDIFSPIAFIAALDRISGRHDVHTAGVAVGSGESSMRMSKFPYADDAALVDDDAATTKTRVTAIAVGSLKEEMKRLHK